MDKINALYGNMTDNATDADDKAFITCVGNCKESYAGQIREMECAHQCIENFAKNYLSTGCSKCLGEVAGCYLDKCQFCTGSTPDSSAWKNKECDQCIMRNCAIVTIGCFMFNVGDVIV